MLLIARDNSFDTRIAYIVGEMENVRQLLLKEIKDLTQEELDYTPDIDKIETIGTLLFHIADVENSWMFEAVESQELDMETWKYAFPLRQQLDPRQQTGKPLDYCLKILSDTREKVLQNVIKFRDSDLDKQYSNRFGNFTLEWVLFHNQQHESHHIGQINLLKRMYRHNIINN